MVPSYGHRPPWWRQAWGDASVTALAVGVSLSVWLARHHLLGVICVAGGAGCAAIVLRRLRVVVWTILLVAVCAAGLSWRSWSAFAPSPARPVSVWATLVTDPQRSGPMVTVIIAIDGVRAEVRSFGSIARHLEKRRAGERVWVSGQRLPLAPRQRGRLAPKHVRATMRVDVLGDWVTGTPMAVAANRVRSLLSNGSAMMAPAEQALFLGLIIGDDHAEPPTMVAEFRTAGLSHLTAVSGQNVGYLLIAAGPLLRRLRPAPRWASTIGLVLWFAVLTRFEPSVLRAAGMALLAATVFWRGWSASPLRLLSVVVTALLLIDPLLAWSVGWWLSVGATAGLALLAKPLIDRLPGPRWLAGLMGVTLAAQTGVAPISVLVFGRAPMIAVVSNVLAVPVAGFVMVWGIPAGLLAGAVAPIAGLVQIPSRIGTRWVLLVARLGARIEPKWTGRWGAIVEVVLVAAVLVLRKPRQTEQSGGVVRR